MPASPLKFPAALVHRQIAAIVRAWGFPADQAAVTADVLTEADLLGIDSHGLLLIPLYDEFIRSGMVATGADIRVMRDFGAVAVIDGGGGFGQAPSIRAMDLAIDKARALGVGAVAVRNSNHYGAAGVYALRAAERGFIGLSTTAVFKPSIVPTFGRQARFGTNPIAFAAPGRRNRPFLLDMATSTVAMGKFKLYAREDKAIPPGWALDQSGRPQTDPGRAFLDRLMTPLGGSREMGGQKGYGLAAMVEILSTTLSGASYAPLRAADARLNDVGHFHLAMHPEAFREPGAFEGDLDALVDTLRATDPADPARPVLVAGDPEYAAREQRQQEGIPVPHSLLEAVRGIAERAGAESTLSEPAIERNARTMHPRA
jgi:LDH2 family malate/lactate/ureidoglycolate dehydrogenase